MSLPRLMDQYSLAPATYRVWNSGKVRLILTANSSCSNLRLSSMAVCLTSTGSVRCRWRPRLAKCRRHRTSLKQDNSIRHYRKHRRQLRWPPIQYTRKWRWEIFCSRWASLNRHARIMKKHLSWRKRLSLSFRCGRLRGLRLRSNRLLNQTENKKLLDTLITKSDPVCPHLSNDLTLLLRSSVAGAAQE